jgi:prepilin-type N-terminal cleavage/methylation domain-containing protein
VNNIEIILTRLLSVHAANRKVKDSMNRKTSRKSGFTLVEIMIVVAIIGLLAAIAIPNFIKARTTSQMNACINNLRQIDGAIQQWALENKKDAAAKVTFPDISGYLKNAVTCPSGGTTFGNSYTITDVATKPVCQKVAATHVLPTDTSS